MVVEGIVKKIHITFSSLWNNAESLKNLKTWSLYIFLTGPLKTIFQRQVQQAEDKVQFENEFIEHMQFLSSIQTDTISTSVITSSKEQRPWMETNLIFYCAQINEARKLKTLVYKKQYSEWGQ